MASFSNSNPRQRGQRGKKKREKQNEGFNACAKIIQIKRNGWGVAEVTSRAVNVVLNQVAQVGDQIAMQSKNMNGLVVGSLVRCMIVPNSSGRSDEEWFCIRPPRPDRDHKRPTCNWSPWQEGRNALSINLPSTEPETDHTGIDLACYRCGDAQITGSQIHRIKNTCVWTNVAPVYAGQGGGQGGGGVKAKGTLQQRLAARKSGVVNNDDLPVAIAVPMENCQSSPSGVLLQAPPLESCLILDSTIKYNKFKRCNIQDVRCRGCNSSVGTYYSEPYFDSDTGTLKEGQPFPCFKITTVKEISGQSKPRHIMVLVGDRTLVADAISQLTPSEEWMSHGSKIKSTGRVDSQSYTDRKQREKLVKDRVVANKARLIAEKSASDAQRMTNDLFQAKSCAELEARESKSRERNAHHQREQAEQDRTKAERDRTKADRDRATAENLANDMVRQCQALSIELGELRPWVLNPTDKTCCEVLTRLGKHVPNVALCQEPELSRRTAIRSYTGNDVYNECNCAARERQGSNFERWSPFIWHLVQGLNALPDVEATVYRGIHGINPQDYKRNKKIHWSGFTSASTNLAVSRNFGGVLFEIQVVNGKDIQGQSQYPQEGEILLSPHMEFVVTQECGRGGGMIKLQQIPSETLWS